jgi:hypothetical protein
MSDLPDVDLQEPVPRLAAQAVARALRVMPVVAIMGARQTGKSTLVQSFPALQDRPYLTLDDLDVREQARTAPEDLVRRAPRLIIDEVQREADLVLAVKRAVDERRPRRPGQFVLTGSANLLLMKRIRDTLAGRAAYVPVWPMTRREQRGDGRAGLWSELLATPVPDWYDLVGSTDEEPVEWKELARRGSHPTPSLELTSQDDRRIWFAGYVQTYLERDLQDLSAITEVVDFRRLMRVACLRLGNVMNKSEMARDAGLAQATAHRYLNLLETSYQLISLEPYAVNRTSRIVKSPKLYWSDTGLAMFLAGEMQPQGAHLENLVLTDLVAWRDAQVDPPQILYWRTRAGAEVDFVIEHGSGLLPIEVKSTHRPRTTDAQGLLAFREEYGDRVRGALLLHGGDSTFWISKDVLAVPWWRVL